MLVYAKPENTLPRGKNKSSDPETKPVFVKNHIQSWKNKNKKNMTGKITRAEVL